MVQRKKQEHLESCILPTISSILTAPYESPLHEIKPDTIMRFIANSTRAECCAPGVNIHNRLALCFVKEMQNNVSNKEMCKVLAKALIMLEPSMQDNMDLKLDLKERAEKLIKVKNV